MKFLYFIFLFLLLIPLNSFGANSLVVVINEIAWMGTSTSANDEWIELYNNTSSPIDISGWRLLAEDDSPAITLKGTIPALGYFLLERTDDTTVLNVPADQIYTGALENTGEKLELRNNNNLLVDLVDCSSSWFAGDNTTKQTMERKNPKISGNNSDNWQNSSNPGGTPRAKNSASEEFQPTPQPSPHPSPSPSPSPLFSPFPSPTPQPSPTNNPPVAEAGENIIASSNSKINFDGSNSYDPDGDSLSYLWDFGDGTNSTSIKETHAYNSAGTYTIKLTVSDGKEESADELKATIFENSLKISEFIPNPKGNDEENEWIELYNDSDQKVDISNWKLKSADKSFVFPEKSFISPKEFLVMPVKTTRITLKNNEGVLELYYPNGTISQKIDYKDAKEDWSIAKIGEEYLWTENPTPGLPNQKSAGPTSSAPPKEQNLNYQNTPEPTPLETEPSPTPEKMPAPLDSKHLTGLKENAKNKSQENLLNSFWFGFALIIIFGFLAGLGLVKIRK